MNSGVEIRPIEAEDWAGIAQVQEATYGDRPTPPDVYRWWSMGASLSEPAGCVAVRGGDIVGVQPMQLSTFRSGERTVLGGMLTGVAVHPAHRRMGIFSNMVSYCEDHVWKEGGVFLATFPNERSKPGFLKRGYVDLGRRKLLVSPLRLRKVKPGWSVQEVGAVPSTWSDVFDVHGKFHERMRQGRSVPWLDWRYNRSPRKAPYRFFECVSDQGMLQAVAVFVLDRRGKLPVWYLMELAHLETDAGRALLSGVAGTLRTGGGRLCAAVCSSPATVDFLKAAGFISVPFWIPVKSFHTVVKFNPHADIPGSLRAVSGWEWFLGDWDNL